MPIYLVKDPDGVTHRIQGPEGASQSEITTRAYELITAQKDQAAAEAADKEAAQKAHLEKTGFMPALKGAGRAALGSAAKFIGESTDSEAIKNYAKSESDLAAQTYEPTTAEDISSAQGILPTASRWISQKVTEPIGGIAGRYGAPMVAGVAGAMLAPEVATTGLVGTALADALAANALRSTIASGVSTAATNFPSATGEVLERQEQAGTQKDMGAALMAGLVNSAIAAVGLPGTGPIAKALGPKLTEQAAVLAKDVIAGKITKDAAVKALASRTENYARAMAANAASGTGMMVGTEAATRAGAGQSLTDEEAMKAYGQSAIGALELAPIFGAFHGMGSRGAAMEKLAGAEQTRLRNEQDAADKIQAHHEATFGGNPDQLALAAQERGADVAGLEAAKAGINAKYDEVLAKQQDVKAATRTLLDPLNSKIADAFSANADLQALDTIEGTKKFMAGLKENKSYTEEEKKAMRPQLQQYLISLKQKEGIQDKLTPAQKEHYDTYEAYDHLGVTSQSQLDSMPLEHLLDAKRILAEKDTPDTPKKMQPVYARIDAILTDTINTHPDTVKQTKDAEFDNVLAAKRAKEAQLAIDAQQARADRIDTIAERDKLEALKTAESRRLYNEKQDQLRALDEQTKPNVPDEMFPRTEAELTPEEKLAQVEQSLPTTPKPRGPAPAPKETLNPEVDLRAIDALRAKQEAEAARNEQAQTEPLPDATSAVGDNQAIRQGSEPSVAVPEPAVLSESKKAEAVAPDTLGVTSGVPRGDAIRGKLAPEAEPVKLATDNKTATKTALEQIREVNDEALREEVSLPDRIVDAIHSALLEPVSKRNMEDWHENLRGALDAARHHIEVVKRARDNASPRGKVGSVLETQERKKTYRSRF